MLTSGRCCLELAKACQLVRLLLAQYFEITVWTFELEEAEELDSISSPILILLEQEDRLPLRAALHWTYFLPVLEHCWIGLLVLMLAVAEAALSWLVYWNLYLRSQESVCPTYSDPYLQAPGAAAVAAY